jgi:hypothetical protein
MQTLLNKCAKLTRLDLCLELNRVAGSSATVSDPLKEARFLFRSVKTLFLCRSLCLTNSQRLTTAHADFSGHGHTRMAIRAEAKIGRESHYSTLPFRYYLLAVIHMQQHPFGLIKSTGFIQHRPQRVYDFTSLRNFCSCQQVYEFGHRSQALNPIKGDFLGLQGLMSSVYEDLNEPLRAISKMSNSRLGSVITNLFSEVSVCPIIESLPQRGFSRDQLQSLVFT